MTENRVLNDIAVKVGKLETLQEANAKAVSEMASSVHRLVDRLDKSDDIAKEADQRAKSAHHRIDDLKQDMGDIRTGQCWLIGTTVSVLALFVTAVGFLWKISGN